MIQFSTSLGCDWLKLRYDYATQVGHVVQFSIHFNARDRRD